MTRTLGILLAGGRGKRLASQVPKALVRVGGITLLERALATLEEVCDEVLVSAQRELTLPVSPGRRVEDAPGLVGPLSGIVAGLGARPHDRALVLGVDFPLIRASALRGLLDRLPGRSAVLPAPGGVPQPVAAAYGPGAAEVLARSLAGGERSATVAALSLDPLLLGDDELTRLEGGLECFLNLNTPADLERAEELLRVRHAAGEAS